MRRCRGAPKLGLRASAFAPLLLTGPCQEVLLDDVTLLSFELTTDESLLLSFDIPTDDTHLLALGDLALRVQGSNEVAHREALRTSRAGSLAARIVHDIEEGMHGMEEEIEQVAEAVGLWRSSVQSARSRLSLFAFSQNPSTGPLTPFEDDATGESPPPPSDGPLDGALVVEACDAVADCNGHGTTEDDNRVDGCVCMCTEDYIGDDCATPPACNPASDCNGHGITDDDNKIDGCTCVCIEDYTGDGCGTPPPACDVVTDCNGHGTTDDVDKSDGCACVCTEGYNGDACGTPPACDAAIDCSSHGTTDDVDKTDGCTCVCTEEFTGAACEYPPGGATRQIAGEVMQTFTNPFIAGFDDGSYGGWAAYEAEQDEEERENEEAEKDILPFLIPVAVQAAAAQAAAPPVVQLQIHAEERHEIPWVYDNDSRLSHLSQDHDSELQLAIEDDNYDERRDWMNEYGDEFY